MAHVTVREHRGHPIVETRFPLGTDATGMKAIVAETAAAYSGQPAGTVLALVAFGGQEFQQDEINLLEAVARANAKTVRATAFLGVSGPQKALFNAMLSITGRRGAIHDTEAAALDWLVATDVDDDPLAGL